MYQELGFEQQSYRIFTVYPDLDAACKSAMKFVGYKFPGEKDVLIKEMIRDAFLFYKNAETSLQNPRQEFIRGLCNRAIFLYRIRYCAGTDKNLSCWLPMVQEITEFESLHGETYVLNEPDPQVVSIDSAICLFAARILPGHLYAEVFLKGQEYDNAA